MVYECVHRALLCPGSWDYMTFALDDSWMGVWAGVKGASRGIG